MAQEQATDLRADQVITSSQLKDRISKEDVFIIDVRNPPEIESSGSIKTKRSINIPLPNLEEALKESSDAFKAKYGVGKPTGDGSDVVFHCGVGRRGVKAVLTAESHGLKKAQNLEGGYKKWVADGC